MAVLFLFNTSTQVHLHFSQVSKIDCLDRVTVRWVDGSESQFNVHPTGTWVREVFKKSKWKFKMAFAMKRGGVSRGSRVPHTYFEK